MQNKPFCSSEIVFLSSEDVKQRILALDANNIVLLLNDSAVSRWNWDGFISSLCRKFNVMRISDCKANPTQEDIVDSLKKIGSFEADVIIAVGGGSIIDLAKALSAFHDIEKNETYTVQDITDGILSKSYSFRNGFIDIIAVPSTAGTGSELTQWGTVWDYKNEFKYSVDNSNLKPKLALIAPDLTLTLPNRLTLTTALDTLSHAMEAFWSRHTTVLVKDIAVRAIELVVSNLKYTLENPGDLKSRKMLSRASVLSALAFSQTRTTASHSISYPLTFLFGVEHGFACAVTLPEVYKINYSYTSEMEELDKIFEPYGGLRLWLDNVCGGVIPLRLSSFGINAEDIPKIVEKAFTTGRMDNNPVNIGKKQVFEILENVL